MSRRIKTSLLCSQKSIRTQKSLCMHYIMTLLIFSRISLNIDWRLFFLYFIYFIFVGLLYFENHIEANPLLIGCLKLLLSRPQRIIFFVYRSSLCKIKEFINLSTLWFLQRKNVKYFGQNTQKPNLHVMPFLMCQN